ncbi:MULTISPECIES: acyl-CoA dehydrogenase family protein [unclassified Pseudomonas]|uniref:acyl-CoA dehydrogenase family protein n=1 Tax=unclassified Pseudomonas TaxID=196821 RepID=UPI0004B7F503|nr:MULTISPECIES: acyl-CoA dehydrogenase family protein [unclassified Pseudomonas]SMF65620.1 Acyl-CoA dehydrogenase [Pseudomonas sp. LAMO17WK12:I1]
MTRISTSQDALRTELLAATKSLAAGIAPRRVEIEALRYLPQDIADALAGAGLYRMLTPADYGGLECHVGTFVEVIELLAQTDASAAWCTFISCTSCVVAAYYSPVVARDLFGDINLKAAGVSAPRGHAVREVKDGISGYRVSGRWSWGSATKNADLIHGGCLIYGAGEKPEMLASGRPRIQLMSFKKEQVSILDNWSAFGLCGSGSGEYEVDNVFVPEAHSVCLTEDDALDRALYKFPIFGLLGIGIGAVALGIARSAIDALTGLANEKAPQLSGRTLAMRPTTQLEVAISEAKLRSARAFLFETVHAAWNAAEESGYITTEQKRDIRLATTHAVNSAKEVVGTMFKLGGGSSVFEQSPLQKCFRDINVAAQHMMVSDSIYELTGRIFLGLETDVSML